MPIRCLLARTATWETTLPAAWPSIVLRDSYDYGLQSDVDGGLHSGCCCIHPTKFIYAAKGPGVLQEMYSVSSDGRTPESTTILLEI